MLKFLSTLCCIGLLQLVQSQSYSTTFPFEIRYGLIILPVEIQGQTYDFLFDTGATTSLSNLLQERLGYKVIKTKNQKDSDGTKMKIRYVQIEEMKIGGLFFRNHEASVHDFTMNPAIECLKIDGIIGSSSMHLSTWSIDWSNKLLTISDEPLQFCSDTDYKYKSDNQKSLLINLKTPNSTLKNIKVDYGSVGSLGVPEKIFKVLKERQEFSKIIQNNGYKMGGLFGKKKALTSYSGIIPFASIGQVELDSFVLKSGNKGLLGTLILRDYFVRIDGKNRILRLQKYPITKSDDFSLIGFGVGESEGKFWIMNVIENSMADQNGIKPGFQLLRIGDIDFSIEGALCDYMFSKEKTRDKLEVEFIDDQGNNRKVILKAKNYYQ
jgi:hypothetical protein